MDEVKQEMLRRIRENDTPRINLFNCGGLTDGHVLPMIEAIRGHTSYSSIHELCLSANHIGVAGCAALATLLEDPNCNLHTLQLQGNNIDIVCATSLLDGLVSNTKLRKLWLHNNPIDRDIEIANPLVVDVFCKALCNTTSINDTHLSNHTLEGVSFGYANPEEMKVLLELNGSTSNKSAAINKILRYHPNIDVEPFFEIGTEGNERNLKALPCLVDWFERAKEAVLDISFIKNGVVTGESFSNEDEQMQLVDSRKLSSIYQFALAMPLLFVPAAHTKACDKKRKRGK